jgi:hypothetical protein
MGMAQVSAISDKHKKVCGVKCPVVGAGVEK